MSNFESLKSMSIDQLAEWLDEHGQFDTAPWTLWFDRSYCGNCDPIMCKYQDSNFEFPCAWCELNDSCKYFPERKDVPSSVNIVKMWLESEVKDEEQKNILQIRSGTGVPSRN